MHLRSLSRTRLRTGLATGLLAVVSTMAAVSAAPATSAPAAPQAAPAERASCPGVFLYGIAGSGQTRDSSGYTTGVGPQVDLVLKDLAKRVGSVKVQRGFDRYPATPVNFKDPQYSKKYEQSVEEGITEVFNDLGAITRSCPNVRIVMVGYSQGAHVAHIAASKLSNSKSIDDQKVARRIAGIGLIADPIRKWRNGTYAHRHFTVSSSPTYRNGIFARDETNWDMGSVLTYSAEKGPDRFRVVDYCFEKDPVCNRNRTTDTDTNHVKAYLDSKRGSQMAADMFNRYYDHTQQYAK